jgi:threonine dehydrogenase-like Zn-dependent dehydrogenase
MIEDQYMPKRLIALAPRKAAIVDYDERPLAADEVRVRLEHASPKHGSELASFRGESPHIHDYYDGEWHAFLTRESAIEDPFNGEWVLGNQWVGRIVEAGTAVTDYVLGERVCGYGGAAETRTARASSLLKMSDEMPWQDAVCYDPAQFAFCGIRDSHLRLGDRVAVIGLGAIGQIAAQMARLAGASYVAVIDPIEKRRSVALSTGADAGFDPMSDDVGLELKKATGKMGVDIVIETSANQHALQAALRGLAYCGTIAYVGWARAFPGGLDLGREAHFNNATIVFSRACSSPNRDHPRWDEQRINAACWRMLQDGQISCGPIIDPVVPFSQSAEAYEEYVDRNPDRSIKLGIEF